MSKKLITLKTGNTSWWKNVKYRREAAFCIQEFRRSGYKVKRIKTYRLDGANTLIYTDYFLSKIKTKNLI
jgi:hypothetical protein